MDESTIGLLKECSSGCQMGMDSVKKMREYVKDPKMSELLEAYGEKHRGLESRISGLLSEYGRDEKAPAKMAEVMSKMDMSVKMFMHPEESQVAKLMMDGCNMGIQSVSEYVNKYPEASAESQDIAKDLIKIEEDFMKEMKGFV